MKKKVVLCGLNWWLLSMVAMMLVSCSGALPKGEAKTKSQWNSFEEAKASYDSIILYETVLSDLQALGFDPYSTPNVRILSYLDIIRTFSPNDSVKSEDLPPSVRTCISAREKCLGYEASPGVSKSVRVGNLFMDLLKFKRDRIETGWSFNALIVIDHGIVVYKIWNGVPIIDEEETRNNPLGPLQDSVGSIDHNSVGI
ncbi:MAG: hypothetical protein V7725_00085 [Porticoccus sp.]